MIGKASKRIVRFAIVDRISCFIHQLIDIEIRRFSIQGRRNLASWGKDRGERKYAFFHEVLRNFSSVNRVT